MTIKEFEIISKRDIDMSGKIVIQSFSGSGLVGSIVLKHLIKELEMVECGYIRSSSLPAIAIVNNGIIQQPFKIYCNDKYVLILCEVSVHPSKLDILIERLYEWYMKNNPLYILIVGAIPVRRKAISMDTEYTIAVSNEEAKEFLEIKGINNIYHGAVFGSIAISLLEAAKLNIPTIAILPHCISSIPDFIAALKALELIEKILDIDINCSTISINAIKLRDQLLLHERENDEIDFDDELYDYDLDKDDFKDFL